jgi:GT2 family glycosyltransferase
MSKASVVIPVHNRRAVTLRCLCNLEATGVLAWADIVLVDDGSSDGTGEAVRERFPAVTILAGDGNLWWGGAIRLGMDFAMRAGADFIIWLNDDCLPDPGTLERLVEHAGRTGGIAAGWAATPSGGCYGANRKTWRGLRPMTAPDPGEVAAYDAVAGNCVVFARAVVSAIGLPDAGRLRHTLLDVDYTLSATEHGFPLDLLGSAVCRNDDNVRIGSSSWLLSDQSPMRQWKLFLSPQSTYAYRASFYLHWKHWGVWGLWLYARGYLKLAAICVLRALVPLRVLRAVYAARSDAWRREQFYRSQAAGTPPPVAPGK